LEQDRFWIAGVGIHHIYANADIYIDAHIAEVG
jgi:hypothetical protein